MEEILGSFKQAVKERLHSTMYGSFFVSWCCWNWKAFYVTFFINESFILQTTNKLKIDYLFDIYSISFDNLLGTLWICGKLFIFPCLSAYLIVWHFSKLEYVFFKKNLINRLNKEREVIAQRSTILVKENEVLKKTKENVEIEKKIEKEKMSSEDIWEADYKQLKTVKNFDSFLNLFEDCLYKYDGRLNVSQYLDDLNEETIFSMPSESLAFLHVNGLLEFSDKNKRNIYATEKGKYFLKKYIQKDS